MYTKTFLLEAIMSNFICVSGQLGISSVSGQLGILQKKKRHIKTYLPHYRLDTQSYNYNTWNTIPITMTRH